MEQRPRLSLPSLRSPAGTDAHTLGLLAVVAAAALWAVAANVARGLFDDGLDPILLTEARAFLALGCFAALRPWRRQASGSVPTTVIVTLGLAIASVNATYYLAIERLAVAVALVVQYTAPALVVGWLALARKRMPSSGVLLALGGAIVGVVLAAGIGSQDLSTISGSGLLLAAASAGLFATYTLLSERTEAAYGPSGAMFRAFAVAALFWLLFQSFRGWPSELFDPENLWRMLYVGVAGTFVPFLLYVWGIKQVASERAVIGATAEPVIAAVIAWIWLAQELSFLQVAGGVIVLAAVVSLQIRRRRKPRAPEP